MRITLFLLVAVSLVFAQATQDPTQIHHDCYYNTPLDTIDYAKGMQLKTQATDSTNISNEPSLIHTVDISGIIDSVIDTATIEVLSHNGKISHILAAFDIGKGKPISLSRRILLRNFKAIYAEESPMTKALDSLWIFIPLDTQVKPSDSIFIKGYSALYKYIWSEYDCRYEHTNYLSGEIFVHPNTSAIKSSRTRKETVIKKCNRDASGKMLKNNTARKIIY